MSKVETCPVEYTCYSINFVIDKIKDTEKELNEINRTLESRILDRIINDLKDLYTGSRSSLEELRTTNEKLREWGEKASSDLDDTEWTLKNVEDSVSNLTDDLEESKKEIEKLKSKLDEIN